MSGLLALLDDVAAIAKVASASIDDIAAASIETIRKSVAHNGNTEASFTKEGTIRSVSVTSVRIRCA